MEMIMVAPFLRGLALQEAACLAENGRAVVCAAPLSGLVTSEPVPSGAVIVDVPDGADETAIQSALAVAADGANGVSGRLFAVRQAKTVVLLAAASTIDEARAILAAAKPSVRHMAAKTGAVAGATGTTEATGPAEAVGSAIGRNLVVRGKTALVTGGAQGFGEEIVRGLVASGAVVFVADLNLAGAERLAAELNATERRTAAIPLAIDVSSESSVAQAFASIAAAAGGLDLVVSNAGVLKAGSVLEQSVADFEFVTKVNYTAFFIVAKYAGLMMKRQHAGVPGYMTDLIQINSKSGLQGSNKNGAYAGSKFGSLGLVQSFALELVEYGVKVNAICPGNFFDGPLWSDPDRGLFVQYLRTGKVPGAATIADVKAFYEAKVPMGRGCEGRDVMHAIYYLVDQRYETGQALPVTGGQVMLN